MIRRVFWTGLGVGIGAAVGILAARQARRTAEKLTPSSLAGAAAGVVGNVGDAIREFGAQVREGMAEREAELSEALGFTGDPYPEEPSRAGGR